jgi:hypothetical protein
MLTGSLLSINEKSEYLYGSAEGEVGVQILRRSESFLGDTILRGFAGSGNTHW